MEEKKKSKKIIISIIVIIIVLVGMTILAIPIVKKNNVYNGAIQEFEKGEYEKAYNTFSMLDTYRDTENYKEKCVTEAKEKIKSYASSNKYEEALKLCEFVFKFEDISTLKNEVINKYILYLIENNNTNKGIELLKNAEGLTEEYISKVIGKYIEKEVYPKAYRSLYSSMKNPSSLNVTNYSISIWYYNNDNLSEEATEASHIYKKDFPYFKAEIKFNYTGTNSFGGVVTNKSLYAYWGKVNEDYTLSDVYLRWNY